MKLTRRQEDFIINLVELSQKMDGPIHYSVLAEHLGVSPFTAYDMLRLLEEKGFVTSEYQLATGKSGPGRAERVFFPTELVQEQRQLISTEAGGDFRPHLLEMMRKGDLKGHEVAEEMLARIPPVLQGQMRYCVEVMTIVALRLRDSTGGRIVGEYLPEILVGDAPACRTNLSLLGGFAFGILSTECTSDREWLAKLLEHVGQYLDIVSKMNPGDCRKLGEYLEVVFTPLTKIPAN